MKKIKDFLFGIRFKLVIFLVRLDNKKYSNIISEIGLDSFFDPEIFTTLQQDDVRKWIGFELNDNKDICAMAYSEKLDLIEVQKVYSIFDLFLTGTHL